MHKYLILLLFLATPAFAQWDQVDHHTQETIYKLEQFIVTYRAEEATVDDMLRTDPWNQHLIIQKQQDELYIRACLDWIAAAKMDVDLNRATNNLPDEILRQL